MAIQFGFEKYCCFIPHRLDTFFVAIWFSMTISFYFVSHGVSRFFAPEQIPHSALKIIPYSEILVCIGVLCGFISSLFGSRKFTKVFSYILWATCIASTIIYILTLWTLFFNFQAPINSCKNYLTFVQESALKQQEMMKSTAVINEDEGETGVIHEIATTESILEEMKNGCESVVGYARIIYTITVFGIQLYQLYFASVVQTYSKKMLYFAQYHKLYAQKQEMIDKQDEKLE